VVNPWVTLLVSVAMASWCCWLLSTVSEWWLLKAASASCWLCCFRSFEDCVLLKLRDLIQTRIYFVTPKLLKMRILAHNC
jgi:hypothetical protein